MNDKKEYLDGLNEYYKLKATYENEFDKEKNKIMRNENLSWKEKRNEYKRLKSKCINCKRPVGTIFSSHYDETEFTRVLTAKCGDIQDPCDLDVKINVGYYDSITDIMLSDEKELEAAKLKIIKDKNNLLFGYINTEQALENFDKNKKEVIDIGSTLELSTQQFIIATDNPKQKEDLQKKQVESYILINKIKQIINDFLQTDNTQLVHDAVSIYVNQLTNLLNEIIILKYPTNRIDYNEETGTYHLIQNKYNISTMEYNYYGAPNVEKFVMGIIKKKDSNKKTLIIQESEEPDVFSL
jgi:hypothetical protein